jgi:hypothetical protein
MLGDPGIEGFGVDDNTPTHAADHRIEAVRLRMKDEVAKAAEWRPGILLRPLLDGEKAVFVMHDAPL